MLRSILARWFLLLLIALLLVGIAFGPTLEPLTKMNRLRDCILAAVLFVMALPLEAKTVLATIRRPWAAILATGINFVFLPLVTWGISFLFNPYLGSGLLVAAATPCTLASASVWTRKAGGNDAAATMVTIFTNLICFVVTPAWLALTIGKIENVSEDLSFGNMVWKLGMLVVLPMVVAQLLRINSTIARWATSNKVFLTSLGQCGILYMVLQGAIRTGVKIYEGQNESETWPVVLAMIGVVCGLHVLALWVGMRVARATGLPRADQIAVGFAGSQKTLMVGLKVAMEYNVSILPMVSYHIGQLLIDTWIADRLASSPQENSSDDKT